MTTSQNRLPHIIGHRGARGLAPENTLAGFRLAAELGVRWVEFDVQLTRDGIAVIIHDDAVDRTTDGVGAVAALDWADVAALDAGGWFGPDWAGEGVPRLDRTLAELAALDLGINVEIKPAPGREGETVRAVVDALAAHWPTSASPPLLSSFSPETLATIQQAAPDLDHAALFEGDATLDAGGCVEAARRFGCSAIHVVDVAATPAFVRVVRDADLAVRVFTVNDPARAGVLFEMGVSGLFTDFPDRMATYLG